MLDYQSNNLREAASWRLATEIVRREPTLRILELHPGGGLYDCLSVCSGTRSPSSRIHLNRNGTIHIWGSEDEKYPEIKEWESYFSSTDYKSHLDRICMAAGIGVLSKPPSSTPKTLTYRFIAQFLATFCFDQTSWTCRSGMKDTAGEGGGVRADYFAQFDGAQERLNVHEEDEPFEEPAYRFWFLIKGQRPVLCLEDRGLVWNLKGERLSLPSLYQEERHIWPLIWRIGHDLLP